MDSQNQSHLRFNRLERAIYPQIGVKSLFNILTVGSACALALGFYTSTPAANDAIPLSSLGLVFGGMAGYESSRIISERVKTFQELAWGKDDTINRTRRNLARFLLGVGIVNAIEFFVLDALPSPFKILLLGTSAVCLTGSIKLHRKCHRKSQHGETDKPATTGQCPQTTRTDPAFYRPHA